MQHALKNVHHVYKIQLYMLCSFGISTEASEPAVLSLLYILFFFAYHKGKVNLIRCYIIMCIDSNIILE